MAHNRVPVVHSLEMHNRGPALEGATVTVEVRDDEGAVSHEFTQVVDLAENGETLLPEVGVRLNPAAMLQVGDRRPGVIVVRVEHEGETLGERTAHVELLSGRHWRAAPLHLAMEMLAAFVMPNDPAIGQLLDEAAVLLEKETGSPSMEGYQSGADRADAIVRSIYQAVQARQIRYAEPPASWGEDGQKVRTPTEVLDGRVGTCLDTTVVLAAAMEQAGIRSLLWVVHGHAFVGYWRDERAFDSIVQEDAREVVNCIDLGLVQIVETTLVTKREIPVPFEQTHRPSYAAYLTGDLAKVFGVIDVWTARHSDVVPLPSRRQTDDGIQVIEYQPARHTPRQPLVPESPTPDTDRSAKGPTAPPRVQQWKNALLDLSLRNRLINYTDRAGLRIRVPEGHLADIEDLVNARKPLTLRPADQIDEIHRGRGLRSGWELPEEQLSQVLHEKQAVFTDVPSGGYATRLRGLAYKARTIVEETGANNLYLALGSLMWSLDGKPLRSPLILVPVRLTTTSRGRSYRLELDESGASTPNYCLLEKLRQVNNLDVPGLAEPEEDDSGIDLDAALNAMRIAIAQKGLPYRVEATADLSILQFAKFRLWKDLDEHWESLMGNSLVRHLVETPTELFSDPVEPVEQAIDLDALDALCPIPADASQLEAITEATQGRTFVLEGPPGTGKSQTITNLLTRAVADGKRILFVAEKRAALDVVSARLDAVGMGAFSLDLHDKGSKPAVVRAQIKSAMDHAVSVDSQGLAADQEDLKSARQGLARYVERLHEPNGAGLSYYSARTQLLALGAHEGLEVLPVPTALLSGTATETLSQVRRCLSALPDVADPARPAVDHPWGFVGRRDVDPSSLEAIRAAARNVDSALSALPGTGPLTDVLVTARTVEDFSMLAGILRAPISLDVLDQTRSETWQQAKSSLTSEIGAFVAAAHPGLDAATPAALDLPLADIHAQAQAAANSGFFGRGKRLKAVLAQIQPLLRPEAVVSHKKVPELTAALLQVQGAVRALASRATGVPGVDVPDTWNPFTDEGQKLVDSQVEWLDWAGAAVKSSSGDSEPLSFVSALRDFIRSGAGSDVESRQAVVAATESLRAVAQASGADNAVMTRWTEGTGLLARWASTSPRRDLDEHGMLPLRRWIAFNAGLDPVRGAGMHAAADLLLTGRVEADNAVRYFDRGLATASIDERRQSTGLDAFDPLSHDRNVHRFTNAAGSVRQQMSTAVPSEVLNARPFQASTGRGQVGELQRELAKQRRGLGVRALLEKYGDLITQLMPCVLVSPDSVARFFPVGSQTFDLVVFDEASQIRVADAVGAMGRSSSVVVVGDSKQMPPTSFADPLSGSDDEFATEESSTVTEDQESILTEAVLARVPRKWLTWHYRSQDESLIAFSNAHYYENKLSSFPAPTHEAADRLAGGHGVSLVRVDGQFHRSGKGKLLRTNPVEADAIFEEILRRFNAAPDSAPSVGVVTFNQQQRAYIEALIRDSENERLIEALDGTNGEGLFIKNLENVQGDERDVILFSTAFSVNEKGVLPLNFGPLTRGGGQRRLNVAVTRARRQVIIFSSFDPAQLRVQDTQAVGIKHLRAYLELAAHGASALTGRSHAATPPDRHRDQIAESLRQRGLVVAIDVGLSEFKIDLTIASPDNPETPLVAVLLDGPGWAGRRTVGDRDGLPVAVLSHLMNWPAVERVWMPAWIADPDEVVAQLAAATAAATAYDGRKPVVGRAQPTGTEPVQVPAAVQTSTPAFGEASSTDPEPGSATTRLPGQVQFIAWDVASRGSRDVLDDLPSSWAVDLVRAVIAEVIEREGPVHFERLARLVAGAFALTRLNEARIESIVSQIPPKFRKDRNEPFAWPLRTDPEEWSDFRTAAESQLRTLEHVSLREIGNAMVALCGDAAGMEQQELSTEALAIFGGRRKTPAIASRLDSAREVAVASGRLKQSGFGRYEAL